MYEQNLEPGGSEKMEPDSKNFKFSNRNRELKNNRTGIGAVGTEKLFDDD